MKKKIDATHYEKTDYSGLIRAGKGRKPIPSVKRIILNITERIYEEASELDQYMGMGYQNVLKAAMTIGMGELYKDILEKNALLKKKRRVAT